MKPKIRKVIRWIARFWAALMAAFILFMAIGDVAIDRSGQILHLTFRESLMMAVFVIVFLGLILAWKWERLGGWMIVLGMAAFYILDFSFSGDFPRGPFFLIIAFPGFLFLICAYYNGKTDPADEEGSE